jgi:probable F420-dependent oxidoreductase
VIRFGVQLPHYGAAVDTIGLPAMAEAIVASGFDGIWLSDHVVLVDEPTSRYPYSPDGSYGFGADTPWYEAVSTMAYLAALTSEVELGTSICVLPQRQPVLLAKQIATVDQLSGGRVRLGVGAGWLAEEFATLGSAFDGRGRRTDDAIALLRACWTGAPPAGRYGDVELPAGVHCAPTPVAGRVPILVGGNSAAALRRAARLGDGWLGAAPLTGLDPADLGRLIDRLRAECTAADRDPSTVEITLRYAPRTKELGTPVLRDRLLAYAELGVTRFTLDLSWPELDQAVRRLDAMARTVEQVRTASGIGVPA